MLVVPKGGTQNRLTAGTRNTTTRHGREGNAKAVTADVTPANMVKCSGNMCQT